MFPGVKLCLRDRSRITGISSPCESEAGESLGKVVAVENFGAGDLLEVERSDGRRSLVPFRDGIADLVSGRIVLDPAFLA